MNDNINNKYQYNDSIDYDQKFENKFSSSSGPAMDYLPPVTVSLRGGNKSRATIISGIKCLWDSGSTNITMKSKFNKPYENTIISSKVECS